MKKQKGGVGVDWYKCTKKNIDAALKIQQCMIIVPTIVRV